LAATLDVVKTQRVPIPDHRPWNLGETGVRDTILEDLALKCLFTHGPFSLLELSELTKLSFEVAEDLFTRLRSKTLCEVTGMSGNVPKIAITTKGRTRALELLSQSLYAGVAPVSLESYVHQVRRQSLKSFEVHSEHVERAFAHMVIEPKMMRQFGTALNSGAPIFLYGPPGTGKTAAAETLSRVLATDAAWIPYAVEAEGQIITVYDPAIHNRIEIPKGHKYDERWVLCRRPAVMVGGELTMDMLDLQFNPVSKYYVGPVQMKANSGVLIIDDFGRQRIPPEELLNRWVVPLDRRIEFLTLMGGRKIEIPFEMLVVFASNRDPGEMMDPAFLRRIQTKIRIGAPSEEVFGNIFRRVAQDLDLEVDESLIGELVVIIRDTLGQELRACQPRDLVNQICWSAKYEGTKPHIDRATLLAAAEAYFLPAQ
jgi:predicted ATPase with chaperone activity